MVVTFDHCFSGRGREQGKGFSASCHYCCRRSWHHPRRHCQGIHRFINLLTMIMIIVFCQRHIWHHCQREL